MQAAWESSYRAPLNASQLMATCPGRFAVRRDQTIFVLHQIVCFTMLAMLYGPWLTLGFLAKSGSETSICIISRLCLASSAGPPRVYPFGRQVALFLQLS